jgi:hypothetical protein
MCWLLLGFELSALALSKHYPNPFPLVTFQVGSYFYARATSDHDPPIYAPSCSCDDGVCGTHPASLFVEV